MKTYPVIKGKDGYEYARVPEDDRIVWAGVPPRLRLMRWEPEYAGMVCDGPYEGQVITDEDLLDELRWLAAWSKDDPERTVVLHGPPGRGKSTYAACCIRRALTAKPAPLWVSWPELTAAVTDSWKDRGTGGERDILRRFINTGFLALDDFGKEVADPSGVLRDWNRRVAFELINGRYERELPTVITTELDPNVMALRFDKAITSRLLHDGRWINLGSQPDRRME